MEKDDIKIGIITLDGCQNFGNRLQNYAVQMVLLNYGKVETIEHANFYASKFDLLYFYALCKRLVKKSIRIFKAGIKFIFKHKHFIDEQNRVKQFKKFNENIKFGPKIKRKNVNKLNDKYDYFAVGSDQIWNPYFFDTQCIMFLTFASPEKRIAIAPSIGVTKLSQEQINNFKNGLKSFKCLSCREESGSVLINSITGKECITLIDPTLMLSKEQWNIVSVKPQCHNDDQKYILLYFLGEITEEYQKIIRNISDKYSLKVINIYDENSKYYTCGPSEFIYMVSHCEIMLTDSFHGCVFSYIYDKPFRIFERESKNVVSMNTRLTNLINVLHLDNLFLDEKTNVDNILNVNYDKTYLYIEQNKFNEYLKKCFK